MATNILADVLRHIRQFSDPCLSAEPTDGELLERFAGDQEEEAFATLLQRHGPLVLKVCRCVLHDSHDTEDAFQATFLVLARQAQSIRKRPSVASWLYSVAYHIAIRARTDAARRRLRERQVQHMPRTSSFVEEWDRQELQVKLTEELQRLPEKYRAPLVLCYLQGKSNQQAARELGWAPGSIAKRLKRACDLLRERLASRGLAFSVALLGVAGLVDAAPAAVPAGLFHSTLRAAPLYAAGQAAPAGIASVRAVALANGVVSTMTIKLKLLAALFLLTALVGGGAGFLLYQTTAAEPDRPERVIQLPDDPQAVVLRMDVRGGLASVVGKEPYLTILADGTAVFGNPTGDSRRLEAKLSAQELQALLRTVLLEHGFFDCDSRQLGEAVQDASARKGLLSAAPDAPTTILYARANGREHEVRCPGLSAALAHQLPEVKHLAQLEAIHQRIERLVTWIHAGGHEGVEAAVRLANEELGRELPEAPLLVAADLRSAWQRPDGRVEVTLERRGVAVDKAPFSFVYARVEKPASGEAKVVVRANLESAAGALADAKPPARPLNIKPESIATDKSVRYDYPIVYVRAPRFRGTHKGKDGQDIPIPTAWPEFGHPTRIDPGYDLMLLQPDGTTEEVLVKAGQGSVTDPVVSFDGESVYYAYHHDPKAGEWTAGADIYKIHVKTRKIVRLTNQQLTPNTGVADWVKDYRTPEKGKTHLPYGVYNLGPCPLPGGKVVFTSNRDGVRTPRGFPVYALQLFVMDDDGSNVEKIGHLNVGCAMHPVVLKDGRIIFSSLESQGLRKEINWGIWSIHPDGTNWAPIISAFHYSIGFHFQSQLADESIVVENYYNQNNLGFGTHVKLPPRVPAGTAGFGPGYSGGAPDPRMGMLFTEPTGWRELQLPFKPYGMEVITRFAYFNDSPAGLSDRTDPKSRRVGKVTHPCGAPDNHLLTVWTLGATPNADAVLREDAHTGIYLVKGGKPIDEPGQMLRIKHDADYNAQWPRPLVPYKQIYGVDEPKRLPTLANNGKRSLQLPEGTPFGLIGTSSLYKRDSFPGGIVPKGSVTATHREKDLGHMLAAFIDDGGHHGNWDNQGADAGLYDNSQIHAIRIVAMEPATSAVAGRFYSFANERLRILGEIPVRKFSRGPKGSEQPVDPDGNPDTSFLAKIPANVAFTFQTLDKDGMVLNMAQTWHQVRPGEVRNDCGGCHSHSQKPTEFKDTAAARADYKVWDLTSKAPLLSGKAQDESGKKWDTQDTSGVRFVSGVKNVEYWRDVRPILDRSCVACHTKKAKEPAGELVLDADDEKVAGNFDDQSFRGQPPGTYFRLALDNGARNGGHMQPMFGKKQEHSWRFPLTSRYVAKFQSRRSLLIWKVFGRRTDGLPENLPLNNNKKLKEQLIVDFNPAIMPPPEAVAGTYVSPNGQKIKVAPLTDEDRRTLVRWIDLGCPIDLDYDPKDPGKRGHGWMLDDNRPTLTLTVPAPGANAEVSRLVVGMHDYDTGLDMSSFEVVADVALDGLAAGTNLAARFKPKSDGVWELTLGVPIKELPKGKLTVSVKDKQGNTTRIERTFSVVAPAR